MGRGLWRTVKATVKLQVPSIGANVDTGGDTMSILARRRLASCFVLLNLYLAVGAVDEVARRELLQTGQTVLIDESNVDDFVRRVRRAERDTVFELAVSEIPVDSVVELTAPGVKLIGVQNRPTRFICSDGARFEISATDVDWVNLIVQDASDGAVVLINNDAQFDPFDVDAVYDFEPVRVNFTQVEFRNNAVDPDGRGDRAGALTVGPGTRAVMEDCAFRGNRGITGGAVLVDGAGSLNVKGTLFEENEATIAGGAIAAGFTENFFETAETVSIRRCRFVRNRDTSGGEDVTGLTLGNGAPLENSVFLKFPSPAPSGGAIYIQGYARVEIVRSRFEGNTAVPAGGALYISDNQEVQIDNCTFDHNAVTSLEDGAPSGTRVSDLELGGAIYLVFTDVLSRATIDRCLFRNNSASYGGVIHAVTELASAVSIENSQFEDNSAELAGGAILFRNTIQAQFRNLRFNRNRATVGGGLMLTNGAGAVFLKGTNVVLGPEVTDVFTLDIYFTENVALDGGGMFLLGAGQVVMQNIQFNRNRARRNGGALCLIASLPSGQTSIQTDHFHSNSARRGGAIYVDSISDFEMLMVGDERNEFIENKALAGGALHIRPSSQVNNAVKISGAIFKRNRAVLTTEAAEIDDLDLPDVEVEVTEFGRRLLFHRRLTQSSPDSPTGPVLLDSESVDACHAGGGGAICLLTALVPERAPVEIEISDVELVRNEAEVGGGIFAATSRDMDWIASCQSDGAAVESLTSKPCKSFSIGQTEFRLNDANSAGGAIFVSHPESVYITERAERGRLVPLSTISTSWPGFVNNTVGKKGFGPNIATNAATMEIRMPMTESSQLLIEGHNSGDDLPEITLGLLDVYGQNVTSGIQDSVMSVQINSSIVSGQRVASAERGRITFSKATALGRPITHPIIFVPASATVQTVHREFSIRQCIVGEARLDEQNICDECDRDSFGFNYSYRCDVCPDDARCEGAASLVPDGGYWHSTPFSPIMHECILEEACKYRERRKILATFYENRTTLVVSPDPVSDEDYPQCAEEYTGPLCGSCVKGYGHVIDGECVECRDVWITAVLICIVCLWTLFLLVSTARAALDTIRDIQNMRMVRVLTMTNRRGGPGRTPDSSNQPESQPGRVPSQGTARNVSFASEGRESNGSAVTDGSRTKSGSKFASMSGDEAVDHIMASEKVSETIKILTNFFQITAVGVGINASWTRSISLLLVVEDSVSSISSGASFAPMECLFKNLEDRTLLGVALRTLFPLALTLLYIIITVFKHRKERANMGRRVIIGFIVGMFFAYDTVTEMLMRIVNCITLDNPDMDDPEGPLIIQHYGHLATATEEYWAEDTQHVCWKGNHRLVAGILGVPGLLVISAGIPIGLALFLLYKRYKGVVLDPEVLNTYGFVYQAYQAKFVFWESIIMLRKASMAAVIVYAYDLGPNLQSAIALGILIFSLLAQFLAQPFKYKSLNVLEALSLLASIFIFYSGVVFRDSNTSYAGKVVLSVIIICTNLLMVCLFIYRLFVTYDHLIIVKLRCEKVEFMPDSAIERIKLLSSINARKLRNQLQEKLKLANKTKSQAKPIPSESDGATP